MKTGAVEKLKKQMDGMYHLPSVRIVVVAGPRDNTGTGPNGRFCQARGVLGYGRPC